MREAWRSQRAVAAADFQARRRRHFSPPVAYPRRALAALTTHDLPTIAGFWRGRDQQLRAELGQFPDAATRDAQVNARERERTGLAHALERERLLPLGVAPGGDLPAGAMTALGQALHAYVARTPAMLMIAQLEVRWKSASRRTCRAP
jgi:(1->4)-alpha-D-glucan 1-alpha-D-glucosylmutase